MPSEEDKGCDRDDGEHDDRRPVNNDSYLHSSTLGASRAKDDGGGWGMAQQPPIGGNR